ncbi:hypothetical protein [Kitasatospora sp. NPDC101183]|uniref:hypothetical protein n=1 Tax=Kitasatospora sp. NPDC101183 TaxID=3364100 RepID=UPI00380CEE73
MGNAAGPTGRAAFTSTHAFAAPSLSSALENEPCLEEIHENPLTSALDPDLAVTRLGGESKRILPVWPAAGGGWTFVTAEGPRELPDHPDKAAIRTVILSTVQVRSTWLTGAGPETFPPGPWQGGSAGFRGWHRSRVAMSGL